MSRKNYFGAGLLALAVSILAACGGGSGQLGGDSTGGTTGGSTTGSTTGTTTGGTTGGTGPTAASITLLTGSPQLPSDASTAANGVTLTALVRDANQNVISGAAVAFATSDSASIVITQGITDASGIATATLSTGGDPQNRSIQVNARSGSVSGSVSVDVVGTTLALSGPTNAQYNTPVTLTATLTDAGGRGIAGRAVQVSSSAGNVLSAATLTTDSRGQGSFTLTGSNTTQTTDTVTITALGSTASQSIVFSQDDFRFTVPASNVEVPLNNNQTVQVLWRRNSAPVVGQVVNFSTSRGVITASAITDAGGQASAVISSDNAGFATLLATSAALTRPSNSLTLEFVATSPSMINVQADPAVIPTTAQADISATVRDVNDNLVKNTVVDFNLNDVTGGTLSAPTATTNSQGLARVVYSSSGTQSGLDGVRITATVRGLPISTTGTLTVASRTLRITLGTGNEIFEPNETTYQFPYSAIVTDSASNPVPTATFSLSLLPLQYFKGFYVAPVPPATGDPAQRIQAVCDNEDINRNGILDPGEDINGNGVLDPGNIASVPGSPVLGPEGNVQFNITYPQDRGNWVRVRLTARASVSGTESVENRDFDLPISVPDASNPPGSPSPYGVGSSCTDPG